jgi:Flp pilus assembly pilin Flp
MPQINQFLKDDSGAVTVDWVVLTAAVVTLALILWPLINNAVGDVAIGIAGKVTEAGDLLE